MVSCRSTKGASKARRDHINAEIRKMRELLPIPAEEQERLSYLHTMSIICTFIRKTILLSGDGGRGDEAPLPLYEDWLQALPGFIVAVDKEGKLVYVSENVSQYLGFSMVDVLQSDSLYELMDPDDVDSVKYSLEEESGAAERSFVCRMNTSKAFRLQYGGSCPLLVQGWFQDPQHCLFVALCSPTVDRLTDSERLSFRAHFQSVHRADMSYTHTDHSVALFLGYEAEELIGRSWYSMLHPDDLSLSASAHTHLIQQSGDAEVELVFRVQTKGHSWVWLYTCASKSLQKQEITCTNYIISKPEAEYIRQKLCSRSSSPLPLSTPISQMPWGPGPYTSPKRQAENSEQRAAPRKKTRRLSESPVSSYCVTTSTSTNGHSRDVSADQALFSTPPYSPASSLSDDCSLDASQDMMYSLTKTTASPSSSYSPSTSSSSTLSFQLQPFLQSSFRVVPCPLTPPPYSYPDAQAAASLSPNYQPVEDCGGSTDSVLHFEDFGLLSELNSSEGEVFQTPEDSGSISPAELLTIDPSPISNSSTLSPQEQAEISVLAHQISTLASSFDLYRTKSSAPCWPSTSTQTAEPLLDEDVIDCILKDWDGPTLRKESGSGWGQLPRTTMEQGSAMQGSAVQGLSLDALVDFIPSELPAEDPHPWPCVFRQDCHEDDIELHQLGLYLPSNFQQDGFADESMY
uniref:Neuronal PAS domain-containing protein 4-like n=1 Tax=Astyanax mexicanus TaxID=7994 RepID=W5LQ89_ASTMX